MKQFACNQQRGDGEKMIKSLFAVRQQTENIQWERK